MIRKIAYSMNHLEWDDLRVSLYRGHYSIGSNSDTVGTIRDDNSGIVVARFYHTVELGGIVDLITDSRALEKTLGDFTRRLAREKRQS